MSFKDKKFKNLEKWARTTAKEVYAGEHGKEDKPELWVCGDILLEHGKQIKCCECGKRCFFDALLEEDFGEDAKKICIMCAYKNHFKELSALEQQIIKKCVEK